MPQLQLPLKPHVYKFLIHADNLGGKSVEIRRNNRWGMTFYNALTFLPPTAEDVDDLPHWYMNSKTILSIDLTFSVPMVCLTDTNLVNLANVLEQQFEEVLIGYVNGYCQCKPNYHEAVRVFLDRYDIREEDYKADSMIRWLKRVHAQLRARVFADRRVIPIRHDDAVVLPLRNS